MLRSLFFIFSIAAALLALAACAKISPLDPNPGAKAGAGPSNSAPNQGTVADPAFTPPGITATPYFFQSPLGIAITTPTPGASIRYTTDGTVPTATTGLVYDSSLTWSASLASPSLTIQAFGFKEGWTASRVVTQTWRVAPCAEFLFNEGAGGSALDTSPNAFTASANGPTAWVAGTKGSALAFSNLTASGVYAASALHCGGASNLSMPGDFSCSIWLKPDLMTNYGYAFQRTAGTTAGGTSRGFFVQIYSNTRTSRYHPMFGLGCGTTIRSVFGTTAASAMTAGAWQHLVATWQGGAAKIYLNGVLVASAAIDGYLPPQPGDPLFLGGRTAASVMLGAMDGARLYGWALSPQDAQFLFEQGE